MEDRFLSLNEGMSEVKDSYSQV